MWVNQYLQICKGLQWIFTKVVAIQYKTSGSVTSLLFADVFFAPIWNRPQYAIMSYLMTFNELNIFKLEEVGAKKCYT